MNQESFVCFSDWTVEKKRDTNEDEMFKRIASLDPKKATNANDILNNTANIQTNADAIANFTSEVESLAEDVEKNMEAIANNTKDIKDNYDEFLDHMQGT